MEKVTDKLIIEIIGVVINDDRIEPYDDGEPCPECGKKGTLYFGFVHERTPFLHCVECGESFLEI